MRNVLKSGLITLSLMLASTVGSAQFCEDNLFFKHVNIDSNNVITWMVLNDQDNVVYQLQEFRWNKWILLGEVNSKGKGTNSYRFEDKDICDIYNIRVRQKNNITCFSKKVKNKHWAPVLFAKGCGRPDIRFRLSTRYEVYDSYGNIVLSGCGDRVEIDHLKRGTYYINYGKEMSKFLKK